MDNSLKQATNLTSSLHLFGRKYKNIIDNVIDEIKIYYQSMKQIVSSLPLFIPHNAKTFNVGNKRKDE